MTLGAGTSETAGADALSVELTRAALECVRKAAEGVGPERIWTHQNSDLITLLRLGEQLNAATAAMLASVLRDVDARGMAAGDGQPSTAAWLAKLLKLTPGEARAR